MKKEIDILHIYAGTSGVAGTYLNEIVDSLAEFKQEVIVSYYFPFNYGKKKFYKYTDLSVLQKYSLINSKIRFVFRTLEFIYGLAFAFLFCLTHKVKIVNYSLISTFKIELYFLKALKRITNSKILITCHDVVPFQNDYTDFQSDIIYRQKFFKLANKLIVHNINAKADLLKYFQVNDKSILLFPFPIMNLDSFPSEQKSIHNKPICYTFIGHLRNEKGIDTLLIAWNRFCKDPQKARLIIAGNIPKTSKFDTSLLVNESIQLKSGYLSDYEYINIIKQTDFVVLPYTRGTNSGIPSSVLSLKKLAITSDIPMFKENPLIHPRLQFHARNDDSLTKLFNTTFAFSIDDNQSILDELEKIMIDYKSDFRLKINNEFRKAYE